MTPEEKDQRGEWLKDILPPDAYRDDPIAGTVVDVPPGGLPGDHPAAGSYLDVAPLEPVLTEPATNVDDAGTAHFCVIPPRGEDFCGGCGNLWPCDKARRLDAVEAPDV